MCTLWLKQSQEIQKQQQYVRLAFGWSGLAWAPYFVFQIGN